jgi:hypothetical protein
MRAPQLRSAVAGTGDHHIATALVKHELNDCSVFDSERAQRCFMQDFSDAVEQASPGSEDRARNARDRGANVLLRTRAVLPIRRELNLVFVSV